MVIKSSSLLRRLQRLLLQPDHTNNVKEICIELQGEYTMWTRSRFFAALWRLKQMGLTTLTKRDFIYHGMEEPVKKVVIQSSMSDALVDITLTNTDMLYCAKDVADKLKPFSVDQRKKILEIINIILL